MSHSREGSDTFLYIQLAHFPKTCGNIMVCVFHPSYKHGYSWSTISKATGEYVRKEWEKTREKHKSHFLRKSGLKKGNSLPTAFNRGKFPSCLLSQGKKQLLAKYFFYLFTTSPVGFKLSFGELRWESYHMKQDRSFLLSWGFWMTGENPNI